MSKSKLDNLENISKEEEKYLFIITKKVLN